jgi:hypothetical protein
MQVKFELSQVEKAAFAVLAEAGGWREAFVALLAYKGVTNLDLARTLGVHPTMISKVKKGRDLSKGIVLMLRELEVPEELLPRAHYLSETEGVAA